MEARIWYSDIDKFEEGFISGKILVLLVYLPSHEYFRNFHAFLKKQVAKENVPENRGRIM